MSLDAYFPSGTTPGSQPTIKSVFQSKEKLHEVDLSIARFFFDACIPFNALNSYYFQPMVDAIASYGFGYKAPSYYDMRVKLLADAKAEVKLLVETYRSQWAQTGCTIMGDGWKDVRDRHLINFLVYCPKGIAFIKSVDASDFISDGTTLCNLFAEIVEIVGSENVVHLVTDNASNYKAAGRLLTDKYSHISWSPCAAHCINLMLKDIGSLPHVDNLKKLGSMITVFIYNHKWTLAFLRQNERWKEILHPGETRFATTFISLSSLYDHKQVLQAMVASEEFEKWNISKTPRAKEVKEVILDSNFWNNCLLIVKVVAPLIRLLRMVDSDERPAMGYVYEGMRRAIIGVENIFQGTERLYAQYTKIMQKSWDRQLRKDVHAAAYWLNPAFQYDQNSFSQESEVMNGLLEVIATKGVGVSTQALMDELSLFRERMKSFGKQLAIDSAMTMRPVVGDEWWKMFGHDAPNLKKLAIHLLSQTSASSGCERNWSAFERIHTKRRNRLEHQRLNDLVYVHYNLRLKNRLYSRKREYDPIDYECIDKVDFWVVEEEAQPEFEYAELEDAINTEENEGDGTTNANTDVTTDEDEPDLRAFVDNL